MKKLIGLTAVAGVALMLSACWGDTAPANNTMLIETNTALDEPVLNETAGNETLVANETTVNETDANVTDGNAVGGNAL